MNRFTLRLTGAAMTSVSRDQILDVVASADQEYYSVREIAALLDVPDNTAKSHFSRNGFTPSRTVERGKRIYDVVMLKRYCLWLYMARESDSPVAYTAPQREEILSNSNPEELWSALSESPEHFVRKVMQIQPGVVLQ